VGKLPLFPPRPFCPFFPPPLEPRFHSPFPFGPHTPFCTSPIFPPRPSSYFFLPHPHKLSFLGAVGGSPPNPKPTKFFHISVEPPPRRFCQQCLPFPVSKFLSADFPIALFFNVLCPPPPQSFTCYPQSFPPLGPLKPPPAPHPRVPWRLLADPCYCKFFRLSSPRVPLQIWIKKKRAPPPWCLPPRRTPKLIPNSPFPNTTPARIVVTLFFRLIPPNFIFPPRGFHTFLRLPIPFRLFFESPQTGKFFFPSPSWFSRLTPFFSYLSR